MTDHYFSTDPGSPAHTREVLVRLAGADARVLTAGGVFSPDAVDRGTAVLLRSVPPPPAHGDLLDLGCGWGPMALTMARLSPEATVWALDVNPRALELTAANAERLGLPGVRAVPAEDIPETVRFASIWSNPPIHVGKKVLHELLLTWLPRLAAGGVAHLVVHKHLGSDSLQTWLATTLDAGHPGRFGVRRASSSVGFRILEVRDVGEQSSEAPAP